MKTMLKTLLAVGCASAIVAQTPNEDALRAKKAALAAADEAKANVVFNKQTFAFVSSQLVSGPPVKGAPYSAEAVNETIQTLADGNRIVQRSSAMQYRDSDGRERLEETSGMGVVFITDPVAGTRYTLHPEARMAEKGSGPAFAWNQDPASNILSVHETAGLGVQSARSAEPLIVSKRVVAGRGRGGPEAGTIRLNLNGETMTMTTGGPVTAASDAKTEDLGKMYIEGVQAQGTRTTTTIPAGDIGNERPINIVDERWYSPDLQMTVMSKHSDPMIGETTFSLKNINRSSPPPTLFEVPSDYTVNAGGRGGRSGGPGAPVITIQPRK
jgi:hypothetical protein